MTRRRLGQLLLIVLVFALAGPLVGLVVTALGSSVALAVGSNEGGALAVGAFLLIYGVLFAHIMGGLPAIAAGLLVAAFAYARGQVPLAVGALAGLVAGLVIGRLLLLPRAGQLGEVELQAAVITGILALAHVIAAVVCTRLTRRWQ